jgi:hypothetical protein
MTSLRMATCLAFLLPIAACKESEFDRTMRLHQEAMAESEQYQKRQQAEIRLLELKIAEQKEARAPEKTGEIRPNTWNYEEDTDKMHGGKAYFASIRSSNTLNFSSPYDGGSLGTLQIRKRASDGTSVLFMISKGQIVCSPSCTINVKFDDRAPIRFEGHQPSDYSHQAIFIAPAKKFVQEVKKAKNTLVEVTYYQAGSQVAEFSTTDFQWH